MRPSLCSTIRPERCTVTTPFKVISLSVSFGVFTTEPLRRLEASGCEVTLSPYSRAMTGDEIIEAAYEADAVVLGNGRMTSQVISALPNLKLIARHGRGIDNIDYSAARRRGVIVTNATGANVEETADLTFALVLDLERHVTQMNNDLKIGRAHV